MKHLVEDLGADVNALDKDIDVPEFWRTPLCDAARCEHTGGGAAARCLLEHGAHPCNRLHGRSVNTAFGIAELYENRKALREWQKKYGQGDTSNTAPPIASLKNNS